MKKTIDIVVINRQGGKESPKLSASIIPQEVNNDRN